MRKCPVCGNDVVGKPGGRPAEYHKDCKLLNSFLSGSENLIQKIDFDSQHKRMIRSRFFSAANLLNCKE